VDGNDEEATRRVLDQMEGRVKADLEKLDEELENLTFSVRLKPGTKKRLARLAQASGRSSNFLISDAIDSYVADQERLLAEVRQADSQVKTGHYIRHEDMKAWLLSWGTDRELPLPKCACGRNHNDETLCR